MSYGAVFRDATGRDMIDMSTFTVRQVKTVRIDGGVMSTVLRYPLAGVRPEMFAVATPAAQLATEAVYDGRYERQGNMIGLAMPAVRTGYDYIELYPPMTNGWYSLGVNISVFANL